MVRLPRSCAVAVALAASLAFAKPPRLTVMISVDALGTDVLQRHRPRLKGGLARLIAEGAFVPGVRYESAECVTAVGHTTLVTGAHPWRHGIVSNKIFNRATGKIEPIFVDPNHPVLEAPLGPDDASPERLLAETLSDRLRASTWMRGKSVAISGKARAAIAMGGRLGEAWWFHEGLGRFVTGTWYRKAVPPWAQAFNDKKVAESYHPKKWELLAPVKDYLGDDDRPFESDWYGMARVFPHPLSGGLPSPGGASFSALASSPMMNDVLLDFAKAAIDGEQLGRDDVPDLVSLSFSSFDRTYHLYGPSSWEMQDMVLRLDKTLGDLLTHLDRTVGRGNVVVVLSADHGGAAIPEEWAALGLEGKRVPPSELQGFVNDALKARTGVEKVIAAIEETDVYLDLKALTDKKQDVAAVRRQVAELLRSRAEVAVALSRDDLTSTPAQGLARSLELGFHPERSGDVLMVLRPFHVLESEARGTSHGTPYTYDAEVPLLLWGRGVKPGIWAGPARAVDVAPTVAALMELGAPGSCEGHALPDVLSLLR
ncbi:MAG: alkaline phosphatase family protein [Myxococcaceae bacterium]|nr:alkaline phosphatase family protein [Myxococcaceae bacterium]